jgi:hypothetical protein
MSIVTTNVHIITKINIKDIHNVEGYSVLIMYFELFIFKITCYVYLTNISKKHIIIKYVIVTQNIIMNTRNYKSIYNNYYIF